MRRVNLDICFLVGGVGLMIIGLAHSSSGLFFLGLALCAAALTDMR